MPLLTREYLQQHIHDQDEVFASATPQGFSSSEAFGDAFLDGVLRLAQRELATDAQERYEIALSVPVTLRPVDRGDATGGCVEVRVAVGGVELVYHRGVKA